ncbi:toll/interleukin-1 receptor domain-containing protein [Nocardia fluminea]|uniref:toll/interleukin-1 receptor domain-containing protein n=1 Tax=Nocardia fluminea TaxID=134984 RepID=UPI00366B70F9
MPIPVIDSMSPRAPDYDIFLSYSRAADSDLATALQRGLARLAKPWNKARVLWVFRDKTDLSAAAGLPTQIENALERARYFLLLASPESAKSKWVGREIRYWQENKTADTFLIAVTDGIVAWDETRGDFDWAETETTAIPKILAGYFSAEPVWGDFRFARGSEQLTLRHSGFRSAVATLAAPVHGVPKGVLDSEDVRQQRTVTRLRNAAIVGLVALLVVAVATGIGFLTQRNDARHQRDVAATRQLIAESRNLTNTDPELARLLAVAAVKIDAKPEADSTQAALRTALLHPLRHVIRHQQLITSTLSPDGRILATGSNDGTVRLTDVYTGRQTRQFTGAASVNFVLAFSADGRKLVTGSTGNTTVVWDISTGSPLHRLESGGAGNFYQAVFSPDGSTLATSTGHNTVILWDAESGRQRAVFNDSKIAEFSPDGTMIATGSGHGVVRLWAPDTGQQLAEFTGDTNRVHRLVFSPDNGLLAVGVLGPTVRLWDTRSHQLIHTLDNGSVAWGQTFSPDGQTIATGSDVAQSVRIWDTTSGQLRTTLTGETIAFGAGTTAATGDNGGHVRLWDTATGQRLADFAGHTGPVKTVAFTGDGTILASMSDDNTVRLWRPMIGRPTTLHGAAADAIADDLRKGKNLRPTFSPDGRVLATSGRPARLWDTATGQLQVAIRFNHPGDIRAELFSPNSAILATSTGDSDWVQLWDIESRKLLIDIPTGRFGALSLNAFTSDAATIATSGQGSIRLWDTKTGALMNEHPAAPYSRAQFSADGATLISIDKGNHEIMFWDSVSGTLRHSLSGQSDIRSIEAISPDGTILATSEGRVIGLWQLPSGRSKLLTGHAGNVFGVAFSRDSTILATGDNEHMVRLWDVRNGQSLTEQLAGHQKTIRDAVVSPDGRTLLTVDDDATIFSWDIGALTGNLIANTCAQVGRSITPQEREAYIPGRDLAVCEF